MFFVLPTEIIQHHIVPKLDIQSIVRIRASNKELKEGVPAPSPAVLRQEALKIFHHRVVDYCKDQHDCNFITHRLWCVLPIPLRPRWLYAVDWDQYDSMTITVPAPGYSHLDYHMNTFDEVLTRLSSDEFCSWFDLAIDIEVSFSDIVPSQQQQWFVKGVERYISLVEPSSQETIAMNREYRWQMVLERFLDPDYLM